MEGERDHLSSSPDQVQETINRAVNRIQTRLGKSSRVKREDDMMLNQANRSYSSGNSASVCIYKVPQSIKDRMLPRYLMPVLVSTSPYHQISTDFEDSTKPELVDSLLNQTLEGKEVVLKGLVLAMKELETKARDCYSEPIEKSNLVDKMVLDGCFIVELLRHHCIDENDKNLRHGSPILKEPELIRELTADLLKLENQLPFFVLEKIFDICINKGDKTIPLRQGAFKLFGHFQPISGPESLNRPIDPNSKVEHLLHLFHYSSTARILNPKRRPFPSRKYHPLSNESMQCATRLQLAGIKFKPRKSAGSFLQIEFRNGVLEIPPIHFNRVTITALLNCIAWEQCRQDQPRYFSAYVGFMNCLIKSDRDVTLLREDGIIRRQGHNNDADTAIIFKLLGDKVLYEVPRTDFYLSKQADEVEAYCCSNWTSLKRLCFSSPWAFISVATATLVFVLSAIQTIMAILAYIESS